MTLRDALIKAMKGRRSDTGRADAVLKLLGLEGGDLLVNPEDLSHMMFYSEGARERLYYLSEQIADWDDYDAEELVAVHNRFYKMLPDRLRGEP